MNMLPVFVSARERSPLSGTSAFYRIPALTRGKTKLHAIGAARFNSEDDNGEISVAWRTMADGDAGFSPEVILAEDRSPWADGIVRRNNTFNGSLIYDPIDKALHLLFSHRRGDILEMNTVPDTGDDLLAGSVRSAVSPDGDGAQWYDRLGGTPLTLPIQSAQALKVQGRGPNWNVFICGPTCGVALPDGNLIAPAWAALGAGNYRSVFLRYNRDARVWAVSGTYPVSSNEVALGWDSQGRLAGNARGEPNTRVKGISSDWGATWTGIHNDTRYPDPVCSASLLRLGQQGDPNITLWAHPENSTARRDLTIHLSLDDWATDVVSRQLFPVFSEAVTKSWEGKTIPPTTLDHFTAYNQLAQIDNDTIGMLLETHIASNGGGQRSNYVLFLVRFNLAWLLGQA
jgi:hypothetical protein